MSYYKEPRKLLYDEWLRLKHSIKLHSDIEEGDSSEDHKVAEFMNNIIEELEDKADAIESALWLLRHKERQD